MQRDMEQNKEDELLWQRYRDNIDRGAPGVCPDANSLAAYLEGNISENTLREIEAHLAGCPDCLTALEELRSLLDLPAGNVPVRITERAKELVNPIPRPGEIRPLSGISWLRTVGWAAAAACIAAAGITGMELGSQVVINRQQLTKGADLFPLTGTNIFNLK